MCGFENKLENDSESKCGFESKLKNVSEDNINFKINEKNNILAIISLKIISKNVIRNLTMFKEYKEKKVSKHNIYSLECIFLSLYMPSLPSSPHYLLSLSISIYISIYLSIFLFTLCNWESSLLISKSFSFIFKHIFMDSKMGSPRRVQPTRMAIELAATNRRKFSFRESASVSLLQNCRRYLVHEDLWKLVHLLWMV